MAQLNVELKYAPAVVDSSKWAIRLFDHCEEGLGNTSDKDKETYLIADNYSSL